jgi:hypothetical protein
MGGRGTPFQGAEQGSTKLPFVPVLLLVLRILEI